ncbi:MAG: DEAD/DEAH box helicase [Pseudomonadota bacterium]
MAHEPESPLSKERRGPFTFLTQTRLEDFDLPPQVQAGLRDAGFVLCTPIQAEVLPLSLLGRDVAGQAQTGTGKTVAFLVTVLTRLLALPERRAEFPSALIIAPTRELALQIYEDAATLIRHTDLTLAQVVGGIDYRKQAEDLRQGADIVICTPGRVIDYFKQGIFKTDGIKIVVIDEADRLLDLGFTRDMRYILRKLPHYEKRQSLLFSATLSYRVLELTYDYMNLPEFISVTPEDLAVEGVEQVLFHVGAREKLSLLLGLLERENWTRVLIFMNTKVGVEWLSGKLRGNGLPAEGITGDLPQRKRLRLMEHFKNGRVKILVATDVASRGIHVEDISHVINYDLPQYAENYVHRIGRTARAGKTGRALSLASEEHIYYLEPIEKMLGYEIPVIWPEDDWFKKDKAGPVFRRQQRAKTHSASGRARPGGEKRPARQRNQKKKMTSPSRLDTGQGLGSGSTDGSGLKPSGDAQGLRNKKRRGRRPEKSRKRPVTQD